jgi:hypothetical protein
MAKILWVQDDHEGPMNGLAEYNGDKVWFARIDGITIPSSIYAPVVSSTDMPENNIRYYCLCRLTDECLKEVTDNHAAHCNETGAPFNHGDPLRIKRRPLVQTIEFTNNEQTDPTTRSLGKITVFNHKINPQQIQGEYVATIKESEFTNFMVPHRVEII